MNGDRKRHTTELQTHIIVTTCYYVEFENVEWKKSYWENVEFSIRSNRKRLNGKRSTKGKKVN